MKRIARGPFVVCAVLLVGCGVESSGDAGMERTWVQAKWTVRWVAGGTMADTLLLQPWRIAANEDAVYVVDRGASRVAAFSAEDGSLRWLRGGPGAGPGEFRLPIAIALDDEGEVFVADWENARITRLSPAGDHLGEIPLKEGGLTEALCPLPDGSLLLAGSSGDSPVRRIGADGSLLGRYELPWSDLQGTHSILQTALLASGRQGQCTLALLVSHGFAMFDPIADRFRDPVPYVEYVPTPEVEVSVSEDGWTRTSELVDPVYAAVAASLSRDTLSVAFAGAGAHANRVIDRYSATDGRYLGSVETDWTVNARSMAQVAGAFYFLALFDGLPVLIAAELEQGP